MGIRLMVRSFEGPRWQPRAVWSTFVIEEDPREIDRLRALLNAGGVRTATCEDDEAYVRFAASHTLC